MTYKGEKVQVLEVISGQTYIWIPSRQVAVWVDYDKLKEGEETANDKERGIA